MVITNRRTANTESDYCAEWDNGTFLWIKDSKIVDSNDMVSVAEVNELLTHILKGLLEYKYMYEDLCK